MNNKNTVNAELQITPAKPLEYVRFNIERPDDISDEQWEKFKQEVQDEIDKLNKEE